MEWIKKEIKSKNKIFYAIYFCICTLFLINCLIPILFNIFNISFISNSQKILNIKNTIGYSFFILLWIQVFAEECVFRLPLWFFRKNSILTIFIMAILLSSVFGYLHGDFKNILIQGMMGFVLSILFFKLGGIQKNYVNALFFTTLSHYLYNVFIIFLMEFKL
jgi:membrane protease YdiL (CAAX protease family)